ncbi:flagellin and related hook-associated protein [Oryzomicrobium terrae]|uniref:Flagellin and related hook-associated protein n=1 Tax=Oryzomicrobium terrae TaxID=1735038 RepID=A0A5C1E615_9RHOO|nr:flagellar hook-associated protein FlgL [Oryzomicrobium terrae]QEL64376.1 flagellin and related hook-associated protein [Oryzomicrobium terrae]
MRVSTAQIYDTGIFGLQRNQSNLLSTHNQLSTGKRVINPSDDPVASARALVLDQSRSVNSLYLDNQKTANNNLKLVEGTMSSVNDLLQLVRDRAVAAGNPSLTEKERTDMATELESRFQDLVGIANSQDGTGQYLFAGFQGGNKPFIVNSAGGVQYQGDDGQIELQVEASRKIAITDSGNDIFMRIRDGNGNFTVNTGGNALNPPSGLNMGTGVIDKGAVTDPSKWNAAGNSGNFTIKFARDYTANPPTTTYDIVDNVSGNSLFTGAPPAAAGPLPGGAFIPGQTIKLAGGAFDSGGQVTITGQPEDGDSFTVAPSKSNQDMFQTMRDLINLLKSPPVQTAGQKMTHSNLGAAATNYTSEGAGNTEMANKLGAIITNLDQSLDKVNKVRASQGARMNELDSLTTAGQALDVQYQSSISDLVDVDYYDAISKLSKQSVQLEAAQKSFVQITGLGLFKIL